MITKAELEELGFHKLVHNTENYAKPGYILWGQEIHPGDCYNKVAIRIDNDGAKPIPEFEYFYNITAVQRYLERNEPVNPNNLRKIEEMWTASYPAPPNYSDKLYHHPDTGY